MELLRNASDSLKRHLPTLALYVGGGVLMGLATSAVRIFIEYRYPELKEPPFPTEVNAIHVVSFIAVSAITALLQTIVFSRMGRDIDRPLWKVRDDREAMQRFYMMWFEFNLITNTLLWLANVPLGVEGLEPLNLFMLLMGLGAAIIIVPFGSAVMFHGRFTWGTLGESLLPLGKRLIQVAPVFLITSFQIMIWVYTSLMFPADIASTRSVATHIGASVVHDAIVFYLDCLVFAAVWLTCKEDRDSPDELDLDF
ncbi:MAG: hypothetical protein SGI88_18450 [Candidatus Hydrogenedentes bacterium]|nr:hypothetical protein [Candidatus Hydrogenedentota bacterium]